MHTKGLLLVAATAMMAIAVADARTVSHIISLLTMLLPRNKRKSEPQAVKQPCTGAELPHTCATQADMPPGARRPAVMKFVQCIPQLKQ